MAVNPLGYMFFSYRRTSLVEAKVVWEALDELGVPVWYDLRDLDSGPTESELVRAISDHNCSGAVLWLTPDVASSLAINRIEIPAIKTQLEADNGYFANLILSDGLDYDDIARIIDPAFNSRFFVNWNLQRIAGPVDRSVALDQSKKILEHRLAHIHDVMPLSNPLVMRIHTRTTPAKLNDSAVCINWTHLYPDHARLAREGAWEDHIMPSLRAVVSLIEQRAPGRSVIAEGPITVSVAFALGRAFCTPRGINLSWVQRMQPAGQQEWKLSAREASDAFCTQIVPSDYSADAMAVLISVTGDVEPAFDATLPNLPTFRVILKTYPPDHSFPRFLTTAEEASALAWTIVDQIKEARTKYRTNGEIHVFAAIPAGLAVLMGQLCNTLGPINLYEHIESGAVGDYEHSVRIEGTN